ncbi:MAG: hypothetical protein AAF414_11275 [Pseudomonadota bacterium]
MLEISRLAPIKVLTTPLLVAAAAFLAHSAMFPSAATGQETCAHPDVLLTLGEITFIDHSEEGAGPGDNRVLIHYLTDENGEDVGYAHVLSTVLHPPEPGVTSIYVEGTMHLAGGTLHWTDVQTIVDPTDTSRSTPDPIEAVISGGTGAFRHASGVYHGVPQGDDAYNISFDISCNG